MFYFYSEACFTLLGVRVPEVRCERSVDRSLDQIWSFIKDMDNWAPMLTGYESHEKADERESTWKLRGDLGPMSRSVTLKVMITEWLDFEKVVFTLEGLDEQVTGGGSFELALTMTEGAAPPPKPWWQRIWDFFFGARAVAGPVPTGAHVVFNFHIEAGGPMGPMINAMLGPVAQSVAEGLLESVGAHLEQEAA